MDNNRQDKQADTVAARGATLCVDIATAWEDNHTYYIAVMGVTLPLGWFLGIVNSLKGVWQSLGAVYNPQPGRQGLELIVYYAVPDRDALFQVLQSMVNYTYTTRGDTHDTKSNEAAAPRS